MIYVKFLQHFFTDSKLPYKFQLYGFLYTALVDEKYKLWRGKILKN